MTGRAYSKIGDGLFVDIAHTQVCHNPPTLNNGEC